MRPCALAPNALTPRQSYINRGVSFLRGPQCLRSFVINQHHSFKLPSSSNSTSFYISDTLSVNSHPTTFKPAIMFSIKAALVALVASGLADASPPSYGGSSQCMSASEAQQVATNFGLLLSNYSDKLANEALAANYEDYTESVASLIDSCPEPGKQPP